MATPSENITTLNQLQKLMPKIIKEHGENQKLTQAAIANPILALEKIGYKLSPSVKHEVEMRVRFNKRDQQRIAEIQDEIKTTTGKSINLMSTSSITKNLKEAIKNETIKSGKKEMPVTEFVKDICTPRAPSMFSQKSTSEPLSTFNNSHEIIPLLLEFRQIEARTPRLSSKSVFDTVYSGDIKKSGIRINKVSFSIQDRERRKQK